MRIIATLTIAGLAGLIANNARAVDSGTCYNGAIASCNLVYPNKDYGDARYKACIKLVLDECDAAHKDGGDPSDRFKVKQAKPRLHLRGGRPPR